METTKQEQERISFYPLPPPPKYDGNLQQRKYQTIVTIDEETGLQKIEAIPAT